VGRFDFRFYSRNYVGVHSVAYYECLLASAGDFLDCVAHHEGVGLANEIRLSVGSELYGCDECPAGRRDSLFGRAGEVGIRADELCPIQDEADGELDLLEVIGAGFAHNDVCGVDAVHVEAGVVQGVGES